MNKNNYTCGIDIGTYTTKVVVMGLTKDKSLSILATGSAPTEGMRLGYITNVNLVSESIKKAVSQAEAALKIKIRHAYVSIGGINLNSVVSNGSAIVSRADKEITHLDIEKSINSSEDELEILNKKIVHTLPISYKLDGKEINGRPDGMKGVKLEVKTLFITCLKQNIEDLVTALALAKITPEDIIASPIASSVTLLSTKQKAAGCVLVDIGAETVSMVVFENNVIVSTQIFPIGSMDITKDIALGLRISLEEAESIKIGSIIGENFPKKKITEIVEARLSDIFELIENQLKRIKRNGLLPAGVIIIGGGSCINGIEEIAKKELQLPVKIGPIDSSINAKLKIRDASWYTAVGLTLYSNDKSSNNFNQGGVKDIFKQIKIFLGSLFSQLLP